MCGVPPGGFPDDLSGIICLGLFPIFPPVSQRGQGTLHHNTRTDITGLNIYKVHTDTDTSGSIISASRMVNILQKVQVIQG